MGVYVYQPKGRAGEYGEWALNLYRGCNHGCKYCYVPMIRKIKACDFHSCTDERKFNFKKLEQEIRGHSGKPLFFCFTSDPYHRGDTNLTRWAIGKCHENGVPVIILTKGGIRSDRDFDLLSRNPQLSKYGASLTFSDFESSREWEPLAAPPLDRIASLKKAHKLGIPTWASLEPVIDPKQSLELIRLTSDIVDEYKVGKINYNPVSSTIDWYKFASDAVSLLEGLNKKYYIKEDLRKYLP